MWRQDLGKAMNFFALVRLGILLKNHFVLFPQDALELFFDLPVYFLIKMALTSAKILLPPFD